MSFIPWYFWLIAAVVVSLLGVGLVVSEWNNSRNRAIAACVAAQIIALILLLIGIGRIEI